ncbi:MAG: SDR family oxidoreductase, partial [Clostridia bacterium]|nr:SDR family oxidoreductase [Clostridia bacterium]
MSRIVVITGASSGFGKAAAKAFAEKGDTVVMAARNKEKLEAACKETGGAMTFCTDVTVPADWERLRKSVTEKYGRIDILINNAGGGISIKEVADQTVEEIDAIIKLNLSSVIYGCREFADQFKKQRCGTVINISSICARQCWPAWTTYAAAKAGVLNFSKGFYLEMKPYGVRVSCVIPSSASTGFQSASGIGEVNDLMSADDIAQTILYVCDLPQRAVVEDVTVFGIDKDIC